MVLDLIRRQWVRIAIIMTIAFVAGFITAVVKGKDVFHALAIGFVIAIIVIPWWLVPRRRAKR